MKFHYIIHILHVDDITEQEVDKIVDPTETELIECLKGTEL